MEMKSVNRLKELGVKEMDFIIRNKNRFTTKGQDKVIIDIYLIKIFSKLLEKYVTPYFYNEKEVKGDVNLYLKSYKELNSLEIALVYYKFDLFRKSFFKKSIRTIMGNSFYDEVKELENKYRKMEIKGKQYVENVCIPNFGDCELYETYKWNFNRLFILNKVCILKFNFMLRIILNEYREGFSNIELNKRLDSLKEDVINLYNGELTIWNDKREKEKKTNDVNDNEIYSIPRRVNKSVGQWKYGTRKETIKFLLDNGILKPFEMNKHELKLLVYFGLENYIINKDDRKLIPKFLSEIEKEYII